MIIVVQHADEEFLEDAGALPFLKAAMTRLARAKLRRDGAPLAAGAQAIDDAAHDGAIIVPRAPSARSSGRWRRNQQFQLLPQWIGNRAEALVHAQCHPHTERQHAPPDRILRPALS